MIAPTGLASDALSTALFVLGPERGRALARAAGAEALWVLDATGREAGMAITPGFRARILVPPAAGVDEETLPP